jgi:hypothetical protein
MAAKPAKAEKVDKAAPAVSAAAIRQMVDELGKLEDELASMDATDKRHKKLKAELLKLVTCAPDGEQSFEGAVYVIKAGPKAISTEIDQAGARKLLGAKWLEVAGVDLSTLKKLLTAPEVLKLTKQDRTGARRLEVQKKAT